MSIHHRPSAAFEFVTPEIARDYLALNMLNRNSNSRRVDAYARQMLNEEWLTTHQGIAFDWNGELVDGQHRLMAIIKAGAGQWVLVVRGLSPDVRYVIDAGRPRSASDALTLASYTNTTKLAAMAKLVILWDEGAIKRSGQQFIRDVSNSEIIEWAAENPDAVDFINEARRIAQAGFPVPKPATLATALSILNRLSPEVVAQMTERMRNLTLHGVGDPLFTLKTRLDRAGARRETLHAPGLLHMYFRVWNALVAGERLTQLKIGEAGASGAIVMAEPRIPQSTTSAEAVLS